MNLDIAPKKRLSFNESGVQFAWDATSISLAETCLRKYQYRIIEGWRPTGEGVHLRFGKHFATALEHYYKHVALGAEWEEALVLVVEEAMEDTWDYPSAVTDYSEGVPLPNENPNKGAPWNSMHSAKNRENLIRTIVWYVDQFHAEEVTVMMTEGKPAVEYSFALPVDDGIIFTGHIDRVVEFVGDPYVMDQKAQPLTSTVLTPTGWTEIGDLAVGDLVAGANGDFQPITAIHPKGVTEVYRVTFNDKSSVLCGIDHLWQVSDQFNSAWAVKSMLELLTVRSAKKFHIPISKPIQHEEKLLPLDPYVLGVLIGDGYFGGNSVALASADPVFAGKVAARLNNGDVMRKVDSSNTSWIISGHATLSALRGLGLWGKLSSTKFLPAPYMTASIPQRELLLQGLLDTDGSWNGVSRIYDTTSKKLAEDICQLVRSLGGTARFRSRSGHCYRLSLRLPSWPTGVGKRYIQNIERVADAETACLSVAHDDHLYITENYTVTHNTTAQTISPHWFNQFKPHTQFSMYTFAGKAIWQIPVKGVIIDGAQINVGFSRFERSVSMRTDEELVEFYEGSMAHIEQAQKATLEHHFPMRPASCGNYGGCEFRNVCSRSPSLRENFLKGDFNKSEPWDPLSRRD